MSRTMRLGAFLVPTLALALALPSPVLAKPKAPAKVALVGEVDRSGAVLVTVNGAPITQGMIDTAMTVLPEEVRARVIAEHLEGKLQEQLILQELLWQEAVAVNLADQPAVQAKLALAARDVLASAALEAEAARRSSDAAVKDFYDQHGELFGKDQVRARHILVADEQTARQLLVKITAGADFATTAKGASQDPGSGPEGGDLGWFERGKMVPEFEDAAFGAKTGTVVGPVKSQFGWHIIEVTGIRDSVPLDDVRDGIRAKLREDASAAWMQELRSKAKVVPVSGTGGSAAPPPVTPPAEGAPPVTTPATGAGAK